jgi:excisionase family DNA binding protein
MLLKPHNFSNYRDFPGYSRDQHGAMKIELHSAEKVAETLGVELDTLYRYARKGKIPALKVGKSWRFLDDDVREFLQSQRYPVKTPALQTSLPAPKEPSHHSFRAGSGEISYAEVEAASHLLADSLLANGIVPGDLVLVLLSNSLEFVIGCFAVWKTGAILVPENPALKAEDLRQILEKCSPQALIMDQEVAERLESQHFDFENIRVVYVKDRPFSLSNHGSTHVESLDAVLDRKHSPKVLRLHISQSDHMASMPAV